jgi:hypothetical protein
VQDSSLSRDSFTARHPSSCREQDIIITAVVVVVVVVLDVVVVIIVIIDPKIMMNVNPNGGEF